MAAYKARTAPTLSHRSTQCARIGLEENSSLMAIVDGSWYAQPPDDKRSDDKVRVRCFRSRQGDEDKAASVGDLVSPIYESTRREK
jgi:hypothetical protein